MKRIYGVLSGVAAAAVAWVALLGSGVFSQSFVLSVSGSPKPLVPCALAPLPPQRPALL